MQIKKFTADSHWAAMQQVKKEWGEDALVLNTRSVQPRKTPGRGGKAKPWVELTAARDFPDAPRQSAPAAETALPEPQAALAPEDGEDFRALVYALLSQTDKARAMGLKGHQLTLYQQLVDSGINEKLVAKMFERSEPAGPDANPAVHKRLLADLMKRVLVCKGPIRPAANRTKVAAFVGPTGVGKTTTIAKLAAQCVVREKKTAALITLDTYRIGAVDQLKVYGEIMRVPVETASGPDEFRKLLRKHSDKDYVFVDTMGRSHGDRAYAGQLSEILGRSAPVETYLVLSVTLQEKIFSEAFRQFSSLNLNRVLFTKLDEGVSYGPMFNFSLRTRLPFSYFTTGQRVPEDIEVAARDKVIHLIFN
ncbi:MAG: flagellar biosynthesis protein FlhF [Nitrospinales bacterium]